MFEKWQDRTMVEKDPSIDLLIIPRRIDISTVFLENIRDELLFISIRSLSYIYEYTNYIFIIFVFFWCIIFFLFFVF